MMTLVLPQQDTLTTLEQGWRFIYFWGGTCNPNFKKCNPNACESNPNFERTVCWTCGPVEEEPVGLLSASEGDISTLKALRRPAALTDPLSA